MWRTPRGRSLRKIAFRDLAHQDHNLIPIALAAQAMIQEGAFADGLSPEQENLVWELAQSLRDQVFSGRLKGPQVIGISMVWKGQASAWPMVAESLKGTAGSSRPLGLCLWPPPAAVEKGTGCRHPFPRGAGQRRARVAPPSAGTVGSGARTPLKPVC